MSFKDENRALSEMVRELMWLWTSEGTKDEEPPSDT